MPLKRIRHHLALAYALDAREGSAERPERDEHFQAPPLFFARTEGSTPFRFSLHVGDVGHLRLANHWRRILASSLVASVLSRQIARVVRLILNQIERRLTEELDARRRRHRLLLMLDRGKAQALSRKGANPGYCPGCADQPNDLQSCQL
jgi:hypothetical protein